MSPTTSNFLKQAAVAVSHLTLTDILVTFGVALLSLAMAKLPRFLKNFGMWLDYSACHSKFHIAAGEGKYEVFEDPFSPKTFWILNYAAIKKFFSTTAEINHRAGFDWFHYAGWDIPTFDPRYKDTVREADRTVHKHLMKAQLSKVLSVVQDIGLDEMNRVRKAVGPSGRRVSLHSLLYRVAYNVNCKGLFGPDMDLVATRIALQEFMADADMLVAAFGWWIPLWFSKLFIPSVRRCVKAKDDMHALLVEWDRNGGAAGSAGEIQAILGVFEEANTPIEVRSTFTNMMMTAFLGNTPEALGWLFTHLSQAPVLMAKVREECDALGDGSLVELDFKKAAPHLHSALFETFRVHVMMGTSAIVKLPLTLPGINHTFQPGTTLKAMGPAAAMSVESYGADARYWKGHRFVGAGESMLQYDLTFSTGRSPCPGRSFALAELFMLAANLIRDFEYTDFAIVERLPLTSDDFDVLGPVKPEIHQIIDLDGQVRDILHPANLSDYGPPGMTSANIPINDFACHLKPRLAPV